MGDREKLLARARTQPKGWTRKELIRLLEAFDFANAGGTNHDKFDHKRCPRCRVLVTRSTGDIAPQYIRGAVTQIDRANAFDTHPRGL